MAEIVDYAYVHARPDGSIFYVGKGRGDRCRLSQRRNAHHKNIVNKYGVENILMGKMICSSHEMALELEKGIIKCLKRMGANLSNITDGGAGALGRPVSNATKHIMSASAKLTSDARRKRVAGSGNPMYGRTHTDEYKNRLSVMMVGEGNPFYGKKHSAKTKERLVKSHASREDVQCPHCSKVGKPEGMLRWHFDHCRDKI